MNPETYQQPEQPLQQPEPTQPKMHNPLESMQPGEQNVCEIKRHPIGIIGTYVVAGMLIVVAAVAAVAVQIFAKNAASLAPMVWGICALIMLVAFVMLFVGTKIYWGNRWVVTSDSITQVSQTSLFDNQSSQLSLGNIEDVTVEQDGVLSHMFGYGTLRVETAGEHSKFLFPFCPTPSVYAKAILNAREQFEQGRRGEDEQRLYRSQGAYPQQPYAYPPPPQQPPQPSQGQGYPPQSQPGYGNPPQQGNPPMPPMPPANPPYDNGGTQDQA
jgi:membrane protein YdbS with pleckstrin-like domain